jgi:hypothetical protein
MIRDPSDGSVRGSEHTETVNANPPPLAPCPIEPISGLPLESQKPEHIERLEKSRAWLVEYFKRNPEQGT